MSASSTQSAPGDESPSLLHVLFLPAVAVPVCVVEALFGGTFTKITGMELGGTILDVLGYKRARKRGGSRGPGSNAGKRTALAADQDNFSGRAERYRKQDGVFSDDCGSPRGSCASTGGTATRSEGSCASDARNSGLTLLTANSSASLFSFGGEFEEMAADYHAKMGELEGVSLTLAQMGA